MLLSLVLLAQFPKPGKGNHTQTRGKSSKLPELDKCTSLDRTLNIRNISQTEIDQGLVSLLAQPSDKALTRQGFAESEGSKTVFGEAEVEEAGYEYGRSAELFLLFGEVGTSDEANCAFVTEGGEELQHFGGDGLIGLSEHCMH